MAVYPIEDISAAHLALTGSLIRALAAKGIFNSVEIGSIFEGALADIADGNPTRVANVRTILNDISGGQFRPGT